MSIFENIFQFMKTISYPILATLLGLIFYDLIIKWIPKLIRTKRHNKLLKNKTLEIKQILESDESNCILALNLIRELLKELESKHNLIYSRLKIYEGTAYLMMSEFNDSKDNLQNSENAFKEALTTQQLSEKKYWLSKVGIITKKHKLYIQLMNSLGCLYRSKSQIQNERKFLEESVKYLTKIDKYKKKSFPAISQLSSESGQLSIQIEITNSIDELLNINNEFESLLTKYDNADQINIFKILYNQANIPIKCASLVSNIEEKIRYLENAQNLYKRAKDILKPDIHPVNFGKILHLLGIIYYEKYTLTLNEKDYKEAKNYFELELQFFIKEKYPYVYSMAKQSFVHLQLQYAMKNTKKAAELLSKAIVDLNELLSIETFIDRPIPYASINLSIAETYRVLLQYKANGHDVITEKAIKAYECAQLVYSKTEYPQKYDEIEEVKNIFLKQDN